MGDGVVPVGDGAIPLRNGVIAVGVGGFMGSRSDNPIGMGGGGLSGLRSGGHIIAGVEDPFAVMAGDAPAVGGNLLAARGGSPVAEGKTGWPQGALRQGPATNVMPPRIPEVRRPPDLSCYYVVKSMLVATIAAQSNTVTSSPATLLCVHCIAMQVPALCACAKHAPPARTSASLIDLCSAQGYMAFLTYTYTVCCMHLALAGTQFNC